MSKSGNGDILGLDPAAVDAALGLTPSDPYASGGAGSAGATNASMAGADGMQYGATVMPDYDEGYNQGGGGFIAQPSQQPPGDPYMPDDGGGVSMAAPDEIPPAPPLSAIEQFYGSGSRITQPDAGYYDEFLLPGQAPAATTQTPPAAATTPSAGSGDTTQIVTGGSEFNETYGTGEGVISDLGTGQPDPYQQSGGYTPPGAVYEDVPGAYDPESGYMLPVGGSGFGNINSFADAAAFLSSMYMPPEIMENPVADNATQFLTADDLPTFDTSQFLTSSDLPTYDTSQFLTAQDLPTYDTSQFLTAQDLPTYDTSQFLTSADLPTYDTSQFLTSADLPTYQQFDPTGLQEQISALQSAPQMDTSNFLTAADLPTYQQFDSSALEKELADLRAQVGLLGQAPSQSFAQTQPYAPILDFAVR